MLPTGLAPGRKLCNKAHTNQEHHWTMPAPGVPNHMTAANTTERTKNAQQLPTEGQDTNKKCLTLTDGEDTNRAPTNAYKRLDQLLAVNS